MLILCHIYLRGKDLGYFRQNIYVFMYYLAAIMVHDQIRSLIKLEKKMKMY